MYGTNIGGLLFLIGLVAVMLLIYEIVGYFMRIKMMKRKANELGRMTAAVLDNEFKRLVDKYGIEELKGRIEELEKEVRGS